jgi:hemerythrin-like domain-containing protein
VIALARSVEAFCIEKIPENLLREPIDYVYADHYRQRTVCAMLDDLASDPCGEIASQKSAALLGYLENDLALHIADEDEDLFPRLKARARPEDGVDSVLEILAEEHESDIRRVPPLIAALRELVAGKRPADEKDFVRNAIVFAESQRHHLAWEHGIIMPLARKRLTRTDLTEIGRNQSPNSLLLWSHDRAPQLT